MKQVGEVELGTSVHKAQGQDARLLSSGGAPGKQVHC